MPTERFSTQYPLDGKAPHTREALITALGALTVQIDQAPAGSNVRRRAVRARQTVAAILDQRGVAEALESDVDRLTDLIDFLVFG